MFVRKSLLVFAIAATASVLPAISQAERYVVVTPPGVAYTPDPVYESVPAPRDGYTWMPGYWSRDGDR